MERCYTGLGYFSCRAAWFFRGENKQIGRAGIMWAISLAGTANFALLCAFLGLSDRYTSDFLPAALLLAGLGGLAIGGADARCEGICLWLHYFGCGDDFSSHRQFWIRGFYDQKLILPIARLANLPTDWWERWRGETLGGLSIELELPRGRTGLSEPLVHMGTSGDARDWFQIDYLPGERARVGFFHAGLGLFSGREFAIPSDRALKVDLECGAFLPPFAHPMFTDWSEDEWVVASRRVRARVNGEEVLAGVIGSYETMAMQNHVGRMTWVGGSVRSEFTGRIDM